MSTPKKRKTSKKLATKKKSAKEARSIARDVLFLLAAEGRRGDREGR